MIVKESYAEVSNNLTLRIRQGVKPWRMRFLDVFLHQKS